MLEWFLKDRVSNVWWKFSFANKIINSILEYIKIENSYLNFV